MIARLDPADHSWMTADATRAVMQALTANNGAARFVGGAVRNALLGEPVTDVDIATPLLPDEVMLRLKAAGLGAVPTGIDHGTVTAVAMGRPFEITSLRRDVKTDGRHAIVAYTAEWDEDAARRDFTMNAIYAGQDGALFDPTCGIADLDARHVRFVGDPATRIREDYLRILRLFRFHAWYGLGEIDAPALAAAVQERTGLKTLSGERVQKELFRLLEAPDPVPSLLAMQAGGILAEILPAPANVERVDRLAGIMRAHGLAPDAILILSCLLPSHEAALAAAATLKLSNADRDRLAHAAERSVDAPPPPDAARRVLYRVGAQRFRDRLLFSWAGAEAATTDKAWSAALALSRSWQKPIFPVDGRDALSAGVAEGPGVGRILGELEQWWVGEGFAPGREALLARLKELAAKPKA